MSEQPNGDVDQAEASHEPRECMPCRGSGSVVSNLGGTPSTVACPWCDGSGVRITGVDAQAKWLGGDAPAPPSPDAPAPPSPDAPAPPSPDAPVPPGPDF